jgi:hypothetical protein
MKKTTKSEQRAANELQKATCGEFLADGSLIEIIRPDARQKALSLLISKEGLLTEASNAQYDGVSYIPIEPDPSILRAIHIPSGVSEYATTGSLFAEIIGILRSRLELRDTTAILLAHVVLSSWLADCLSAAPRLLVYGPPEESAILLQLLAATCRRALLLSDVNIATWSSALAELRPTVLINARRLRSSTKDFLDASNMRQQYVLRNGQLIDFFGVQIIHERSPSGDRSMHESAICVTVSPASGRLRILTDADRAEIAHEIQGKLLGYRMRNYDNVRRSEFDVSEFTGAVRSHARMLGACLVGAPELQSGLIAALRGHDEDARTARSFSLESVLIEVLILLCHESQARASATVGEITAMMNMIFQGRDEPLKLEARKVGDVLRSLQFFTARQGSAARGISLLLEDRRRIHQLARDYDVPTIHAGVVGCPQCAERKE